MAFAEGTTVSPEKTLLEIFALLKKNGGTDYSVGSGAGQIGFTFRTKDRLVRFTVAKPSRDDKTLKQRALGRYSYGTPSEADWTRVLDAEERRLWRCLLLALKAKFEAVESKIETFDESFLAHIVTDTGETVMERLATPQPNGRLLLAAPTTTGG